MEQHQNWLRIVVCLDVVGLPALKSILHVEIGAPEDGKKLYIYLDQFTSAFEQEGISADQKKKLFPSCNITDEDKFDITLYSLIINTIIKFKKLKIQTNRKFIYGLRNLRNRIYHMGDKKIEQVDFETEWKRLEKGLLTWCTISVVLYSTDQLIVKLLLSFRYLFAIFLTAFAIYDRNLFVFKRARNLKLANFRNLT